MLDIAIGEFSQTELCFMAQLGSYELDPFPLLFMVSVCILVF